MNREGQIGRKPETQRRRFSSDHNKSKYAKVGGRVDAVLVDTVSRVIEQLDYVIERWREFVQQAAGADDHVLAYSLMNSTDAIEVSSHHFMREVPDVEARFLAALGDQQATLAAVIREDIEEVARSSGDRGRDRRPFAGPERTFVTP